MLPDAQLTKPTPPHDRPSWRLAGFGGWLLAIPLAAAAGARVVRLDESSSLLLLASGLTPLLWPPALAAFVIGLGSRRPALTLLSGGVAALYLTWALSGLGVPRAAPSGAASLRLFSANLQAGNPDLGPIAAEIGTARPDVVVLQELGPAMVGQLRRSGVLDAYPYRLVRARPGAFGIGVWSRFPLLETDEVQVEDVTMLRVAMTVGGRRVPLWAVHTVAPVGPNRDRWHRQLAWLASAARQDRPLIVAGDLNATRWHRGLGKLLADGLDDAHERRGRGWAATWPRDRWPLPPVLRLDHVLVSPEIGVQAVREGIGVGSDHRPIVADLAVVDRAPATG
jgi:endonuclease/exonuclease/phosphatase (EEP) superfamily protein YafD